MILVENSRREYKTVEIAGWKFGLCHGHQIVPWGQIEAMAMMQRQLDADVLISGHTHKFSVDVHEGNLFINPGSATGAYSGMTPDVVPSFVLLDVQEKRLTIYVYELHKSDGAEPFELKVKEIKHSKP
jgi:vacuolar protein sorting-associated protein 29